MRPTLLSLQGYDVKVKEVQGCYDVWKVSVKPLGERLSPEEKC